MSLTRRFIPFIAAVISAGVMTACGAAQGQSPSSEHASETTAEGGSLVYLEHASFATLYPPEGGTYQNGGIINNIADRLVYQDPETLEFEPWLAKSWEINDDATTFRFTLRDDVTFSDGSPLTADVVAK